MEYLRRPHHDEWDEERTLSDAELIKGGAEFTLGRLAITGAQWEKARLVRDILFPVAERLGLDEPSTWRELLENTHLDEPVAHHWERMYPGSDARVLKGLKRAGVESVRDLLVIGRKKTGDIRNLGPKSVDRLAAVVEVHGGGQPWLDVPSVLDIVAFCDSIYQVNAKVLIDGQDNFPTRMTVRDALILPEEQRAQVLGYGRWNRDASFREHMGREVYAHAEVFALQFDEAKGGIWTDPRQFEPLGDS